MSSPIDSITTTPAPINTVPVGITKTTIVLTVTHVKNVIWDDNKSRNQNFISSTPDIIKWLRTEMIKIKPNEDFLLSCPIYVPENVTVNVKEFAVIVKDVIHRQFPTFQFSLHVIPWHMPSVGRVAQEMKPPEEKKRTRCHRVYSNHNDTAGHAGSIVITDSRTCATCQHNEKCMTILLDQDAGDETDPICQDCLNHMFDAEE